MEPNCPLDQKGHVSYALGHHPRMLGSLVIFLAETHTSKAPPHLFLHHPRNLPLADSNYMIMQLKKHEK